MKKTVALLLSAALLTGTTTGCGKSNTDICNFTEPEVGEQIVCVTVKDYGEIKIKLFPDLLPKACENFVGLAQDGYYDELIFHRVISNFMMQGGDPRGDGTGGESVWGGKFDGGVSDALCHVRGAVAYANSGSAEYDGSQFYIVTGGPVEEATLDQYEKDGYGPYTKQQRELYTTVGGAPWLDGGYTVFGQVISGLDIAVQIADETETDANHKPYTAVQMESVTVEEYDGSPVQWYVDDTD